MVFESVNLDAGQASLPETNPDGIPDSVGKKMKKRSKAWAHFTVQNDDPDHARCNYCDALLGCKSASAGTASLVNHLKICKKNPAHIGSNQTELTYQACDDGNLVVPWQYIDKEVRKSFARMIVVDELPFIFAEKEGFRFFVSKACPRFNVPSRTTMYRDIIALYESEKAMLRKYFIDSRQTVCLTTDTWTSKRQQSYMVLTAHYIDCGWKLRKKIISFVLVDGHKGDDIGKSLEKLLIEWGIERVCTITVDNASSNDTCLAYMKRSLTNRGCTHANSQYLHMRTKESHFYKDMIEDTYGSIIGNRILTSSHIEFVSLFGEYKELYGTSTSSELASQARASQNSSGSSVMRSRYNKKRMRVCGEGSTPRTYTRTELDKYLAEDTEELTNEFDLLEWWKCNAARFPVLSKMARDILAIPISTVASESAFSTSGRILDDFRSSLTPATLQALICTQDWLRSKPINVEADLAELTKLEEDVGALNLDANDVISID